jgi:hypothetical protein
MPEESPPRRWPDAAVTALLVVYVAGIAAFLWHFLHLPDQGDEFQFATWYAELRTDGWLAALRRGYPVGYLVLVQLAGGDRSYLAAGRAVGVLAIVLLGVSVWWICSRSGVSPLGRRLAVLTFLNVVLAGRNFVFMAIADSVFTLVTLWVVIGIARAIVDRRPGLAIVAGAGWALSWVIRPLALLYAPAIAIAIVVLLLRDPQRGRALGLASLAALACAIGVLLEQAPALRATGRPAVEQRNDARRNWLQLKHLSLIRYHERGGTLIEWLRVPPLVRWDEVRRYTEQHGEDSLPRTRLEAWRRHPLGKAREVLITLFVRTSFHLAALLGALFPLAWLARTLHRDPSSAGSLTFAGIVIVAYTVFLTIVVSPFLEWRWLLLPCVAFACAGSLGLERLRDTRRGLAAAVILAQIAFLGVSFVVWIGRAIARPIA